MGEPASSRSLRPSSRPSAFGPPRASLPSPDPPGVDGPPHTSELRLKRDPRARFDDDDEEANRPTLPRVPPRIRPSVPTDLEHLLPISPTVKSLPRPPRMPVHETAFEPAPRRLPWASVGVFACALLASVGSLVHYTEVSDAPHPATALGGIHTEALRGTSARARAEEGPLDANAAGALDPHVRAALRSHLAAAWTARGRASEPLLVEAQHALGRGDHRLAAHLYATLKPLHPAASALGLAQVARAHGDRAAAAHWTHRALAERPGDPRPHRLYAELLDEGGQPGEARLERAVARGLSAR